MNWSLSLFGVYITFVSVLTAPADLSPCAKDDTTCLTELTRVMFKIIVPGIDDLGISPSDPISLGVTEGNFDKVKYAFTDSELTGLKNCEIESTKIIKNDDFTFEMNCPDLKLTGQFTVGGTFFGAPIKGAGNLMIQTHDYHVSVTTEVKRITGSDGVEHLYFKNFKYDADLKKGFEFDLGNLFNGNKELAAAAYEFGQSNWQAAAKLMQGPIVQSSMEAFLKNYNKYLKSVPANQILKS